MQAIRKKNKGVWRKVREKEPMLEIDKLEPLPIITRSEGCTTHKGLGLQDPWSHGERRSN